MKMKLQSLKFKGNPEEQYYPLFWVVISRGSIFSSPKTLLLPQNNMYLDMECVMNNIKLFAR